ncbi:aminoacyl-tRNA hydrolase [Crassaminicella thermophila]|uniref:Peptidyl-tRNA hydrolase n=1 Tax=Crassaminicella thermophila TaxID=2599308 RepID=A0A5C0SAW1_CRATE|nr:aminoacyl-tRNA hydrolase [Crassaminicella thermophila]QEK11077.1 aminoacyl-tRNA hydrolase [Crassaminicella thermophila]
MLVVVGLGNPGKQYEGTRHNVGFDTIDYLAYRNNISINKVKHKAVVGDGFINNKKVMLVKPQTYMNLSGRSLLEIVNFYKIDMDELIVIYDDIDTDVGKIRIRRKGSAGTHNGMKSIIYEIQSDQFPRIRIGIGKPTYGNLADFVLGKFSKEEKEEIALSIKRAAEAVETFIKDGIDIAMNRYNG